ncbi:MAG: hypothetical protein AB1762_13725 [Gemmatimonadota bacterium]
MRASSLSLPRPRSRAFGRRAWRLALSLAGASAAALLAVRTASAIDAPAWERLLNPTSFHAALAILLASLALTLGALGAIAWGVERRRRVAIVAGVLILLILATYWLTRPFATGAL